MKKSILLLLVLSTHAHSKSLLDYILNPNRLAPDAFACAVDENDELKTQCVQELCKGISPDLYPMILKEDKFEEFMARQPQKPKEEILKKAEAKVDAEIRSILKGMDELIAGGNDGIIKKIPKAGKADLVTMYFMNECVMDLNPSRPEGKKIKIICKDEALQKHPARASIETNYETMIKSDWTSAMATGYFSDAEITQKVPARESELKKSYDNFKALNPSDDESKKLIDFLDKNWGKYATLPYAERMKYVKALDRISGVGSVTEVQTDPNTPTPERESTDCTVPECTTLFDEMVKSKDFIKKVVTARERIAKPEFKKLAMASIKVQETLVANAPTEKEIESFDESKEKVIKKILEVQKKHMSEHSYGVYEDMLEKLSIGFDESLVESTRTPNAPEGNSSNSSNSEYNVEYDANTLLTAAIAGDSEVLSMIGADMGSPIALISDHYIDPKYKDFSDEDFEIPEINYSLFSLKEKAYGEQILAHEIGHHFSHMHIGGEFSKTTTDYIDRAKSCVKTRYEKFSTRTGMSAGDHYLEEEFADEFGFTTVDENSMMLFCPILVTPYDPDNHLSLEIMSTSDTHPQDLWRSLNQMKFSGRDVPLPCKELMLKNSESYEYKKCL